MLQTLRFIWKHPLNAGFPAWGIYKFFRWQIVSRLINGKHKCSFTEYTKLLIQKGMTGATGNIYCGLLEYEDMSFLLHLLRANDLFVDIGANVGVYTVLASGEIGANSISIEPIPTTFSHLSENITLNDISSKVVAFNIGLGSKPGKLFFTKDKDTVNHVSTEADKHTMEVQVNTLDNILQTQSPILIKIDVEGFETEVLKGSSSTLSNPALKAIIIELNGSGNRYGYDENTIHDHLLIQGFQPFSYAPQNRTLHLLPTYNNLNTIYIRDLDFVASRVKEARKIKVGRHLI